MATQSSILAWRIPWTEKPGGLQFMESQRVGCDWATNTHTKPVNNVVIVSGGQWRDPALHTQVSILPQTPLPTSVFLSFSVSWQNPVAGCLQCRFINVREKYPPKGPFNCARKHGICTWTLQIYVCEQLWCWTAKLLYHRLFQSLKKCACLFRKIPRGSFVTFFKKKM